MLRNSVVVLAVAIAFFAYGWMSPMLMPGTHALTVVVNVIVVALFGALAGYFLTGYLIVKLAALVLIPTAQVLLFGGDPAKPGLENLLALVELSLLWVGCIVTHAFLWKKARAGAEQSKA